MPRRKLLIIILLFSTLSSAFINIIIKDETYCYADDKEPYLYFGTKSQYAYLHPKEKIPEVLIPDCKPIMFWSFIRHGTRLPTKKEIQEMRKLPEIQEAVINNINNLETELCEKDINLLQSWKWNDTITDNIAETLTFQGWNDMKIMAKRYKLRYPELFNLNYNKTDEYLFRFTRTERTNSSFQAVAEELFGNDANKVQSISYENDTLLEAQKHCKSWIDTVKNNPKTKVEYNRFKLRPEYQNMISGVSRRLGFKSNLNDTVIKSMYDMCRYEQAWYLDKKSAWCTAFTKTQLTVLTYAEDLKYYYGTGPGTELNKKMGCSPLKDMMERFDNAITGVSEEPKAIFYFSHSSPLQLLLTSMKMYVDNIPLTADNMNQQEHRLWQTSLLIPFAANFDTMLFRCTKGEKYQVQFFLHENPAVFRGCNFNTCSWKFLKKKYWDTVKNCNLDFCENGNVDSSNTV